MWNVTTCIQYYIEILVKAHTKKMSIGMEETKLSLLVDRIVYVKAK